MEPITREEMLLDGEDLTPITRKEKFIKRIYDSTQEVPEPITREEYFLKKAGDGGGGDIDLQTLTVTENGEQDAPSGVAYDKVITNVPQPTLSKLTVTENGTQTAAQGTAWDEVEVAVEGYKTQSYEASDIITFNDGVNLPMLSCVANIEAVQDLHGYDKPWPAGGGKNKFTIPNYSGSTYLDVSYSFNSDTNTLSKSGTSTGSGGTNVGEITVANGTYTFSAAFNETGSATYIYLRNKDTSENVTYISCDYPSQMVTLDGTYYVRFSTAMGATGGTISNIQLELGNSRTTFAPYSNICPISGWTGCNVPISGINLANFVNGHGIGNDGMPDDSQSRCGTTVPIFIKPNNDYYFTSQDGSKAIYAVWSNGALLRRTSNVSSGTKLKVSDGDSFYICIYNDSTATVELGKPMVALNNSATYAPYVGSTYSLTWSSQGTIYGGYVDLCSGVLVANRTKIVLDGNNANSNYSLIEAGRINYDNVNLLYKKNATIAEMSSSYKRLSQTASNGAFKALDGYANEVFDFSNSSTANKTIRIRDDRFTDLPTALSIIATEKPEFVFELDTPQTYQLTAQQVKSLLGANNIFADCGKVSAEVWKGL